MKPSEIAIVLVILALTALAIFGSYECTLKPIIRGVIIDTVKPECLKERR